MPESLVSFETLVHAIAGATGSSAAMTIVLPLDTARTRLILDKNRKTKSTLATIQDLVSEEGLSTLFRGSFSTIQSVFASNFIYFYTFHGLKLWSGAQGQSALKDLMFACCAGACNVVITNPLWVVNSRLKMQGTGSQNQIHIKGLLDGLVKLGKAEGRAGLWAGTAASLVLVSNPAIKFTAYEFLKRFMLSRSIERGITELSPVKAFVLGAIASAIATIITYPIQVVQTKARHGHNFKDLSKNAGLLKMTVYILRNFGPNYLYKGLEAKLIQSIVTAGFMFLSYEKIASLIFTIFNVQKSVK